MLKLYFAPRTRAVRIVWLLEELRLDYELKSVEFVPTKTAFFAQQTPTGKLPTLEDGDIIMCESGAIIEYLLERYGDGRLAPPIGTPARAKYLQWLHYSESTAQPPLGIVIWLTVYRNEADKYAELVTHARKRAVACFDYIEKELGEGPYLLGDLFTAADIMMGFTVAAGLLMGAIDDRHPRIKKYFETLETRPAFRHASALT